MAVDKALTFEKAVEAYKQSCGLKEIPFQQPSEEHSNLIHDVMYLRVSPVSYVARYDIRRKRVLA
ncbi:MAG: hypothetical protein KTR27_17155 [Leptolyngbyaceae cyanobacterium MAG.088]|nr:hypothetical protein [Leptolyngbyaceae cyanobacterium MAG.088]